MDVVAEVLNVGRMRPELGAAPSTIGLLTVNGRYRQIGIPVGGTADDSGSLLIDIGGTTPGIDHDQLFVTGIPGQAELGGGLFVDLVAAFDPQTGQTFTILTSATLIGTFDVVFMPGLPDGRFMRVEYAPGSPGPGGGVTVVCR